MAEKAAQVVVQCGAQSTQRDDNSILKQQQHIHVRGCVRVCVSVCLYVCACVCVCVPMYVCTCTYVWALSLSVYQIDDVLSILDASQSTPPPGVILYAAWYMRAYQQGNQEGELTLFTSTGVPSTKKSAHTVLLLCTSMMVTRITSIIISDK